MPGSPEKREIRLGTLAGLSLAAAPSALAASPLLWLALSALAVAWLRLSAVAAVIGGGIAVLVHWASEITHQLGHAWAARRTGYPMQGIRLWGALSASIYPNDEGELPARVHTLWSLLAGLAAGIVAALAFPAGGLARYLSLSAFGDYLGVLALGAFAPLGFTGGSTLLRRRGKR